MFDFLRRALPAIILVGAIPAAHAHPAHPHLVNFATGFLHPLMGVDHLLAMVAVGLWAAQMRRLALWILPLAFPFFMVSGAIAARYLGQVPVVEAGVAGSVFLLGLAIASAWRAPKSIAVLCITCFGILHGYAHGTESPGGIEGISYATGFVMCTAMLHCAGIALGFMLRSARLAICLRAGGAAIAAIGFGLLASAGVAA